MLLLNPQQYNTVLYHYIELMIIIYISNNFQNDHNNN